MDERPQDYDPRASSLPEDVSREVMDELYRVRSSIDNIDAALIHLLAERFKATQRVGVLKARHSLPAADPGREAAQIGRLKGLAQDAQLDPVFAEKFLNFIVSEVIRHHQAISDSMDSDSADPNSADLDSAAPDAR